MLLIGRKLEEKKLRIVRTAIKRKSAEPASWIEQRQYETSTKLAFTGAQHALREPCTLFIPAKIRFEVIEQRQSGTWGNA